jgi:hypothetical protein
MVRYEEMANKYLELAKQNNVASIPVAELKSILMCYGIDLINTLTPEERISLVGLKPEEIEELRMSRERGY